MNTFGKKGIGNESTYNAGYALATYIANEYGPEVLRDIFDDSFKGIFVDDKMLLQEVKEYLDSIAPKKSSIVSHYKDSVPIFEKFDFLR